jgi:hypothetical protein
MFGLLSAHTGYPVAFALTGVVVLAALPARHCGQQASRRASSQAPAASAAAA